MKRILLVDDEPNILNSVRRCLLGAQRLPYEVAVECFTSARAALERAEVQEFDLIISDYRMPEMSGVDFLLQSIESNPSAVRMLMTAYADLDAVIAAINRARVARFICKPWKDVELRACVCEALASRERGAQGTLDGAQLMRQRMHMESPMLMDLDVADDGGIVIG